MQSLQTGKVNKMWENQPKTILLYGIPAGFLWTFLLEHVILNVILKKLRSIKMDERNNELYTYMVQILANPVKN